MDGEEESSSSSSSSARSAEEADAELLEELQPAPQTPGRRISTSSLPPMQASPRRMPQVPPEPALASVQEKVKLLEAWYRIIHAVSC